MALKFQFFLILNACLSNYQWSQYPLWQTKVSAEKRTTLLSKRFNLCGLKICDNIYMENNLLFESFVNANSYFMCQNEFICKQNPNPFN